MHALINMANLKVLHKLNMKLQWTSICSYYVAFCCACWLYTSVWPCHWVIIVWMSPSVHTPCRTTTAIWWTYQATSTSAALQAGATCKWKLCFNIWTTTIFYNFLLILSLPWIPWLSLSLNVKTMMQWVFLEFGR